MKNLFFSIFTTLRWVVYSAVICLIALSACQETPTPPAATMTVTAAPTATTQLVMSIYEGPGSVDLLYPAEWKFLIPQTGLLVFGARETIDQAQPGPMMTVLRVSALSADEDAAGELNHYLEFGPYRSGYELVGDIETFSLIDREGLQARLTYAGNEENIPMEAYIAAAEADNGAIYIFTGTSPADVWEAYEQTFRVMVNSVEFNE